MVDRKLEDRLRADKLMAKTEKGLFDDINVLRGLGGLLGVLLLTVPSGLLVSECNKVEENRNDFIDRLSRIDFSECLPEGTSANIMCKTSEFNCSGVKVSYCMDQDVFFTSNNDIYAKGDGVFFFGNWSLLASGDSRGKDVTKVGWTCLRGNSLVYNCKLQSGNQTYKLTSEDVKVLSVPFKKLKK